MSPNPERIVETFLELVRIPSPSKHERAVADAIIARLKTLGYAVEEDAAAAATTGGNAGNLIVRIPATGEGEKVFLVAHMDTVETGDRPIVPIHDGDEIRSDGTTILGGDDVCGVTVLLEFLACLKENPASHGELIVAFTVCEEIGLLGIGALEPSVYAGCAFGVALDHSAPASLIIAAPYKLVLHITVHGIGGHACKPEGKINPVHVLSRAVARLASGRLDDFSTANIGILQAGERVNVIPDHAYGEYEIRSERKNLLDFHLERSLTTIEAAVREARFVGKGSASEVRKATVDVEADFLYEGYRHESDAAVVKWFAAAIEAVGMLPVCIFGSGGSDANVLNQRGLPTVVAGCGMHSVHTRRESARVSEMVSAVQVLGKAVAPREND